MVSQINSSKSRANDFETCVTREAMIGRMEAGFWKNSVVFLKCQLTALVPLSFYMV